MFAIVKGRVIGEQKESEYGFEFSLGESLPKDKNGQYQNNVIRVTVKDANDFVRKYAVSGNQLTVCASALKVTAKLDKEGKPVAYQQAYANAAYVKLDFAPKTDDAEGNKASSTRAPDSKSKKRAPAEDEIIDF